MKHLSWTLVIMGILVIAGVPPADGCEIRAEMLRAYEAVARYWVWQAQAVPSQPAAKIEYVRAGNEFAVANIRLKALCHEVIEREGPDRDFHRDFHQEMVRMVGGLFAYWVYLEMVKVTEGREGTIEMQVQAKKNEEAFLRLAQKAAAYFKAERR